MTKPYPIRIATDHLGANAGIGTVSPNNWVTLNLDVPFVTRAIKLGAESDDAARAVLFLVAGLFAAHAVERFAEAPYDHRRRPNVRLPWMTDWDVFGSDVYDRVELYALTVAFLLDRGVVEHGGPHLSVVPPSGGDAA
jgi:hypothetical protein